jgi:hypothetical protein
MRARIKIAKDLRARRLYVLVGQDHSTIATKFFNFDKLMSKAGTKLTISGHLHSGVVEERVRLSDLGRARHEGKGILLDHPIARR